MALAACAPATTPQVSARLSNLPDTLPPMKTFAAAPASPVNRSNQDIAADFLDLAFQLESGRALPVLTRFEGPISVRVTGTAPPSLGPDLAQLLSRFRREAGISISQVPPESEASITIEVVDRSRLQRYVPHAACFVVPRVSTWDEFRRNRRGSLVDWATLNTRDRLAIFLPGDVSPQEIRDCLHEEMAQALGPLNDLYRLSDSVFNDDNFHTVLTGFDMLILRAFYSPALQSGMGRRAVAEQLPGILATLNPGGQRVASMSLGRTPRDWISAIESALGPRNSGTARKAAATRAVAIARANRWTDNRLAFSLFALGRLSLASETDIALNAFLQAREIYDAGPETRLHAAHVAMQLAAFSLSTNQPETVIELVDSHSGAVAAAENAALLASLLLLKAEALDLVGRRTEASAVRTESLGWARYGFGSERLVRERAAEIASLSPQAHRVAAR